MPLNTADQNPNTFNVVPAKTDKNGSDRGQCSWFERPMTSNVVGDRLQIVDVNMQTFVWNGADWFNPMFATDPLTGAVTGLVGPDGAVNRLTQPSVKYKFFIPGQQFIGSGTSAKDKSTNTADAAFMASLTEANAWANPGYFTTGAGVNLGLAIPFSKVQFDLASQSIIFSVRVKKVATAGSEAFIGCGDASSVQGFYLSMRALSGGVSKVRPILNTSGGVVSGLADSAATFGEATATDHVLTLAIDAVTKSVFLYCDGALSNTYPSAYTGGTTLSVPFGFGFNTGTSGVTTVAGQFSGAHMLVMTGGLPLNMGLIAQRLSAAPQLPITDADMVF